MRGAGGASHTERPENTRSDGEDGDDGEDGEGLLAELLRPLRLSVVSVFSSQPHQKAPLRILQHEVSNDNLLIPQRAQQRAHSGSYWCAPACPPPSRDQAHHGAWPGLGLHAEESLRVGGRFAHRLTVQIERCLCGSIRPIEHRGLCPR